MKLRYYQEAAVEKTMAAITKGHHPMFILPTGTGKTVVGAEIIKRLPGNTLFLAHSSELVSQAKNKISLITGVTPNVEMAEYKTGHADGNLVASVQSLTRRLPNFRGTFPYILTDEAHRSPGNSYQRIYDHFGGTRFGMTATPDRSDSRGYDGIYDSIAYQYSLVQAMKDGYLARLTAKKVTDFDIDLRDIKINRGDLDETELANRLMEYVHPIAQNIIREMGGRKSMVFMPNVYSSELIADTLNALGAKAAALHGTLSKEERKGILYAFHTGQIQYLVSCNALLEGFDEPSIEGVVMLRPTQSRLLYSQAVGRGTRIHEGKENVLLLEFTYNSDRLRLVKPYELFTASGVEERVQDRAPEIGDEIIDLMDAIDSTSKQYYSIDSILNRATHREYDFVYFDPLALSDYFGIDYFGEVTVVHDGRELQGRATEAQKNLLHRYAIGGVEDMTKAQASMLITKLKDNGWFPTKGPISPKQAAFLSRRGVDTAGMTKAHATILISLYKEKKHVDK